MGYINHSISVSDLIPEEDKLKEEYLVANIDYNIATLVYEKHDLIKAYNYYNGVRGKEQFKALEEYYGITSPTLVEFTPLIRRDLDALIGHSIRQVPNFKITCKDGKSIDLIAYERNREIAERVAKEFNRIAKARLNQEQYKELGTEVIESIAKEADSKFQSIYEKAAQALIKYFTNSLDIDFRNKRKLLATDLFVCGQCYYKTGIRNIGEDPELHILNPLDVFFNKNTNETYLKATNRVVWRRYMTRQEVLNEYGHYMSDEDKETLMSKSIITSSGDAAFFRTPNESRPNYLINNTGTTVERSRFNYNFNEDIIPVYYTEWLANNEVEVEDVNEHYEDSFQQEEPKKLEKEHKSKKKVKRYRLDRYEGVKIGHSIYVAMGKSRNIVRPVDKPYDCELSINGIAYSDRNGTPYSLMLATSTLQDKYDLLLFHRDAMIANAGTKGSYVDINSIPTFYGAGSAEERMVKWTQYKKAGIAALDLSQENASQINTIYGGYDDTISGQALMALNATIQSIEVTASKITGVTPQMLGEIEQREAASNVKVGIAQSSLITKQFFFLLDQVTRHFLLDMLNLSKIAYAKGKKGSYILGDRREFFTIEPNDISLTDFDIHISDTDMELKSVETMKQFAIELARNGQADLASMIDLITADSLTETKESIKRNLEENSQKTLQQLSQQLEELQKQNQALQKELEKAQRSDRELAQQKIKLDSEMKEKELKLKQEELKLKERLGEAKLKELRERTLLEKVQAEFNPTNKDNEVVNLPL